jgi:matrixin
MIAYTNSVIHGIISKVSPRLGLIAILFFAQTSKGYVLENISWTRDRNVVMQLSLNRPRPLMDGSTSFNQVALSALNIWNQYLVHLHLSVKVNSPVPPADNDEEMSVFFSDTAFGESLGDGTLAITLTSSQDQGVLVETDTIFNTAFTWDSYRGRLLRDVQDFRRVAIHEFGHTLGLDHPDDHGQQVNAIMNSRVGNLDTVQPDDINGVRSLYNSGPPYRDAVNASVLRNLSTRALIGAGEDVLIGGFIIQGSQPATIILRGVAFSLRAAGITNPLSDPTITVYDESHRVVATNDDWISDPNAQTIASYRLDPPNSLESALYLTLIPGSYSVVMQSFSNATQPATTGVGLIELYDLHLSASRAGNISSRGRVFTGQNVLIAGFIVGGTQSKQLVVRAIGPSLATAGIADPLADPTLELRNANGALIQSNNNWQQQNPNAQAIASHHLAPTEPRESALLATLVPGSYTAIVRGVASDTGTAVVEVYDIGP